MTFNDETNTFHTSYGTIVDGEATIVGVSIKTNNIWDKGASIEGTRGKWYRKASGRVENIYPEFEVIKFVSSIVTVPAKSIFSSIFRRLSTTNTFDASKSGLIHGGSNKEKMGKSRGNMPGDYARQNT